MYDEGKYIITITIIIIEIYACKRKIMNFELRVKIETHLNLSIFFT